MQFMLVGVELHIIRTQTAEIHTVGMRWHVRCQGAELPQLIAFELGIIPSRAMATSEVRLVLLLMQGCTAGAGRMEYISCIRLAKAG